MQKCLSVIVPCYNVEKYLKRCLDSIINQTYKNLEIICVNDGSTDNTLSILEEYAQRDNRVKVVNKKNGGLSSARNAGLDVASCEYITFVDSDDWLELETYEIAMKEMKDDIDFVKWGVKLVNEDDIFYVHFSRLWFDSFKLVGKFDVNKDVLKQITIEAWDKIFRKSIIDAHNIRFPEGLLHEDHVFFWHYALFMKKAYFIPDKLYNYYQRKGSIVNNVRSGNWSKNFDKLKICDRVFDIFVKEGVFEEYRTIFIENLFMSLFLQSLREVKSIKSLCKFAKKLIYKWQLQYDNYFFIYLLLNDKYDEIKANFCMNIADDNRQYVSVIVPVYNREKFLRRCLDSIVNQTYKYLEIICVDDASTDGSFDILQEYASRDSRVRIFKNKKNMGIGYTRQVGFDKSTCDYIMWCDSDDWYEPTMCEKMLKTLLKYKVDMVECNVNIVDDMDLVMRKTFEEGKQYSVCKKGKQEVEFFVYNNMKKCLWNKIFRRNVIEKWSIQLPQFSIFEDVIFVYLYLMRCGKIYFLQKALYNYYRHEESVVSDLFNDNGGVVLLDEFRAFKYVVDFVKRHDWTDRFYVCNEMYYKYLFAFSSVGLNVLDDMGNKVNDVFSKITLENINIKPLVMNIFFACDNNYVEQLYVAMHSILLNAYESDVFNFYILDGGISKSNKRLLEKLRKVKDFSIQYILMDNNLFEKFPITDTCNYISKSTYFRYLIPLLKPDLQKCLYLDCDLVVNSTLRELYNMEFEDNYVVAVQDASQYVHDFYKKFDIEVPFNAGVLLINNEKWRKDNISDLLMENTCKLQDILIWQDQDVLNYTFKDKVKFVEWKYNLQQRFFIENVEPYKFNREEIFDSKTNPVIVHYAGSIKPWQARCVNPFWWMYYTYLKQTPFKKNVKKYLKKILKEV